MKPKPWRGVQPHEVFVGARVPGGGVLYLVRVYLDNCPRSG